MLGGEIEALAPDVGLPLMLKETDWVIPLARVAVIVTLMLPPDVIVTLPLLLNE